MWDKQHHNEVLRSCRDVLVCVCLVQTQHMLWQTIVPLITISSVKNKQTEREADVALHCCRFSAINNMLSSFSVAVFSYIYDMQNVKNFYEHSPGWVCPHLPPSGYTFNYTHRRGHVINSHAHVAAACVRTANFNNVLDFKCKGLKTSGGDCDPNMTQCKVPPSIVLHIHILPNQITVSQNTAN